MSEQRIALAALARQKPPPLTLYIHLPWCEKKCPYCDFNSHRAPATLPEEDYLAALLCDMESALPQVWGRPLGAVFIGGGTPSLFSPPSIDRLLAQLRALFNLAPDTEITLEANPNSADAGKFAAFRAAGVNRLSIGAQSFNDAHLQRLGRLHSGRQAHDAVQHGAAQFGNINIDLMHALPGQSAGEALEDIRQAATYQPAHLSLYQLTLEPGTPFFRQPPAALPDEDAAADIADAVGAQAAALGYQQYETSAYAKDGRRCQHNLNYWRFGDYLGIGAGAHSKITAADGVWREQRVKQPQEYMRRARSGNPGRAVAERRRLGRDDIVFEFMLNALRLTEGFPTALLTAHTGGGTPLLRKALDEASAQQLIERQPHHIRPTRKGQRYLNDLTALFLPVAASSA